MRKRCNWKMRFYLAIVLLLLLLLSTMIIIVLSFLYGKYINDNSVFGNLIGTFLGVFVAMLLDRVIDKFKELKTYKNWLILLKKELIPLRDIEISSTIRFDCLHNLINSPDFSLFIKDESFLLSLYNLHNDLNDFCTGQRDARVVQTIRQTVNEILLFIK